MWFLFKWKIKHKAPNPCANILNTSFTEKKFVIALIESNISKKMQVLQNISAVFKKQIYKLKSH